jgi:hypothetical protein
MASLTLIIGKGARLDTLDARKAKVDDAFTHAGRGGKD